MFAARRRDHQAPVPKVRDSGQLHSLSMEHHNFNLNGLRLEFGLIS
jgi:hypothetical protein